ncbi:MAG TPA: hypothetical protein VJA44_07520 [Acidimicrobiia bacterium]|nr:hypothetical protein [Acidimicrobiia bacterium]HLE39486.1 hypothetical protein [Acidimicrobiia bacterium]
MRRITLAGIGLVAALAAVPAIALAQSSDPGPATTPVECPFHAAHAGLHSQMHGIGGTMIPGGGMRGMSGLGGMPGHAGMHQQMGSMMSTQG